ncbi:MAG: type II secretion system F family protein [bacterium]|nr:type II secretion system F family protein [bacterium]
MSLKIKSKTKLLSFDISFGSANLTQVAIFARNLEVMIRSGLTISEALEIGADSASGKFKRILLNVMTDVNSGTPLADAFAQFPKVFSPLFINSVYAGESSGTLEQNLNYIATQLEKERELSQKVKGAMLYPIIVLVATFGLGMTLSFFVLPKIIPLFQGLSVDLPLTTRMLISFSELIEAHGLLLFVGIVAFFGALIWYTRQKFSHPLTHMLILKLPVVKKISKNANLARFCRTLGSLIKSGLTIDEAMQVTAKTMQNYYFKKAFENIREKTISGSLLSDNMIHYRDLFPKLVTRMVRVGEESGKLEETLLYLADFYDSEVDSSTKSITTTIEPVLLIFIGLVVAFLALSIITPIYSITGNISR